jgi:hypothetical protein
VFQHFQRQLILFAEQIDNLAAVLLLLVITCIASLDDAADFVGEWLAEHIEVAAKQD